MSSVVNPGICFVRLDNPTTDHGFIVNFSNQMPERKIKVTSRTPYSLGIMARLQLYVDFKSP